VSTESCKYISELKNPCSIIYSILSKDVVAEDLSWSSKP